MKSSDANDSEILELLERYADGGLDAEHCRRLLDAIRSSPELKDKLAAAVVTERLLRVHKINPPSLDAIMEALPGADAAKAEELRKGSGERRRAGVKIPRKTARDAGRGVTRSNGKGAWNRIQRQDERGIPVWAFVFLIAFLIAGIGLWARLKGEEEGVLAERVAIDDACDGEALTDNDIVKVERRAGLESGAIVSGEDHTDDGQMLASMPAGEVSVSQVKYEGQKCARLNELMALMGTFRARTGASIKSGIDEIELTDTDMFNAPVLYMAGHGGFSFTASERDQLGKYLRNGGFLFVESCCGRSEFDKSFRDEMRAMGLRLSVIPRESLIYSVPNRIGEFSVTPSLASKIGSATRTPDLEGVEMDGNYAVIYSRYGLAGGWVTLQDSGVDAYNDAGSVRLAQNILLYAITH